jgi:hypothetical protein
MSEELAGVLEIVLSPRPDCHRSLGSPFCGGAIVAPKFLGLTNSTESRGRYDWPRTIARAISRDG